MTVDVTLSGYLFTMRRTYRYRLYPTRQQTRAMLQMLDTHRHLYNRALAERRHAWEQEQRSVHYEEQSAQLKGDRTTNPYLAQTNFSSCQATLRRLKQTFETFFRRVQAGQHAGYPRFKGRDRFDTVEFPKYGDGCKIDGGRVYFQHIGHVRIVLHRPFEGMIKTLSFTHRADDWYLTVSCDLGDLKPDQHSGHAVGIDVGLTHFATFSTGEQVANRDSFVGMSMRWHASNAGWRDTRKELWSANTTNGLCAASTSESAIGARISRTN